VLKHLPFHLILFMCACVDGACILTISSMCRNAEVSHLTMRRQDYEAVGAELVLFGSRDGVLSGDSWSELPMLRLLARQCCRQPCTASSEFDAAM
jgi:hypothetical protein